MGLLTAAPSPRHRSVVPRIPNAQNPKEKNLASATEEDDDLGTVVALGGPLFGPTSLLSTGTAHREQEVCGLKLDNRTIVVTGGTGFFGSHLLHELERSGATPISVGRANYDLLDRAQVVAMLEDHAPDALVHLAGTVGGIGANRREPGRFLYENALMGLQVLEACRIFGIEKVLVIGTVCSYPSETPVPFRESDLWNGFPEKTNAPYGVAKRILLTQIQAYREQYGMNAIYLIPVNLYGPRDNFDLSDGHVIPAMIRRFTDARESGADRVTLWGDGSPTREFLHVSDAARACRLALEHYDGAEPVNVGSGEEISIKELARLVSDAVGYHGRIDWNAAKPNGQVRRRLDVTRAREFFQFEAAIDLAAGIAETVRWYQSTVGASGDDRPTS